MDKSKPFYEVNLLRPGKGRMRAEVISIVVVLLAWGGVTFGFQLLLWLTADSAGDALLTRFSFFNLPFHFWFTGQFLPLWFIIICALFNWYSDRLALRLSRQRDETYE